MRRLTIDELKSNGFQQVKSMQCYHKDGVIVSYGLIVAINNKSSEGYHDYSSTTSKQVTVATGICTSDRRKDWAILDEKDFEKLATTYIKNNIS